MWRATKIVKQRFGRQGRNFATGGGGENLRFTQIALHLHSFQRRTPTGKTRFFHYYFQLFITQNNKLDNNPSSTLGGPLKQGCGPLLTAGRVVETIALRYRVILYYQLSNHMHIYGVSGLLELSSWRRDVDGTGLWQACCVILIGVDGETAAASHWCSR